MTSQEKLQALHEVGWLLENELSRLTQVPPNVLEKLAGLYRTMSSLVPKSTNHNRGAYALCAACGRYSMNPRTCLPGVSGPPECDCGRSDRWTKHFPPPGKKSSWSFGLPATRSKT